MKNSESLSQFFIRHLKFDIPSWCERGDSNPHGFGPLDPKSSASANSATFARGGRSLAQVGAPTRTRTWNQQIKSLLLYQLSYGGSEPRATKRVRKLFRFERACQAAVKQL